MYQNSRIFYTYDYLLYKYDLTSKKLKSIDQFDGKSISCGQQLFLIGNEIYYSDCDYVLNKFNLETYRKTQLWKIRKNLSKAYRVKNKIMFLH